MTAVPKPLKFLRPHYEKLEKAYESWPEGEDKVWHTRSTEAWIHTDITEEILCRHVVRAGNDILR